MMPRNLSADTCSFYDFLLNYGHSIPLIEKLDMISLMALQAANKSLYQYILHYLFQPTNKEALLYQSNWFKVAVSNPRSSLKPDFPNRKLIQQWSKRDDLTIEMWSYNLIYNARQHNLSLQFDEDALNLLDSALISLNQKNNYYLQILLPPLLPLLPLHYKNNLFERIIKRIDNNKQVRHFIELIPRNLEILQLMIRANLLTRLQVTRLSEKIAPLLENSDLGIAALQILCLLVPKLQAEQVNIHLPVIIKLLKDNDTRSIAGKTLSVLLSRLSSESIDIILQDAIEPPKHPNRTIPQTALYITTLSALADHLSADQIKVIWFDIIDLCNAHLIVWQEEINQLLAKLLPRLSSEHIAIILPHAIKLLQHRYESVHESVHESVRQAAYVTLSVLSFYLSSAQIKTILLATIELLKRTGGNDKPALKIMSTLLSSDQNTVWSNVITLLKDENEQFQYVACKILSALALYLPSKHIDAILLLFIKLLENTNKTSLLRETIVETVFSLLPCLSLNHIDSILPVVIDLVKDTNKTSVFKTAGKILSALSSHLSQEHIDTILPVIIELVKNTDKGLILETAYEILSALSSHLSPEHIDTILPVVIKLAKDRDNKSILREKAVKALSILSFHLSSKQINALLPVAIKLLNDRNVQETACETLSTLSPHLSSEQINAILSDIENMLCSNYYYTYYSYHVPEKVFELLITLLPRLTQEDILSVLFNVNQLTQSKKDLPIQLFNFIHKALPRINFALVSQESLKSAPLLIVMKLMAQWQQQINNAVSVPPISERNNRFFPKAVTTPNFQSLAVNQNSSLSEEQKKCIQKLINSLNREVHSRWPYPNKTLKQIEMRALDSLIEYADCLTLKESLARVKAEYPLALEGKISTRTRNLFNKLEREQISSNSPIAMKK
ncbi:hypothetical protein [Legionella fairfieldensis]|uniref:hypothetical protein n=1 Tax=Legionella fairfieldensis TaxID=45064 RepID=UPI00056C18A4|nr:hypothetical protein [Legionella fairfieldensis]